MAFLIGEFFNCTIRGAFGRNSIYTEAATDAQRAEVRDALWEKLNLLEEQYRNNAVSEEAHFENIRRLSQEPWVEHGDILQGGRLRIGTAQKALNLYLKYLWCLGLVNTPPHCPFDEKVIAKLPSRTDTNWTTLDNLAKYRQLRACPSLAIFHTSLAQNEKYFALIGRTRARVRQ